MPPLSTLLREAALSTIRQRWRKSLRAPGGHPRGHVPAVLNASDYTQTEAGDASVPAGHLFKGTRGYLPPRPAAAICQTLKRLKVTKAPAQRV